MNICFYHICVWKAVSITRPSELRASSLELYTRHVHALSYLKLLRQRLYPYTTPPLSVSLLLLKIFTLSLSLSLSLILIYIYNYKARREGVGFKGGGREAGEQEKVEYKK